MLVHFHNGGGKWTNKNKIDALKLPKQTSLTKLEMLNKDHYIYVCIKRTRNEGFRKRERDTKTELHESEVTSIKRSYIPLIPIPDFARVQALVGQMSF